MMWLQKSLNRIAITWQLGRQWFGKHKPERERLGYRAGLYPQEYSEADRERLGLKQPDRRPDC